ncbi:MAG: glycosyltransferase family 2 protein [Bacteroidota bacterium]|nr:glycosyltransferase family 2 protein [Bacteroidota bacterium]
MLKPLVSILIPVYNGFETIEKAIQSCIIQTYSNFELLIYNDGSKDNTKQIIQKFYDSRIVFIDSTTNQGIVFSRNQLLKIAKGDFIAWLDADDCMMPNRLEKQLSFFDENSHIDICGSWMYVKNSHNESLQIAKTICDTDLIKTALWFKNYIFQPTIMSRNFYMKENIFYNERFNNVAEDYALWIDLMNQKNFANISEPLIIYNQLNQEDFFKKQIKLNLEDKLKLIWEEKWQLLTTPINLKERRLFEIFVYKNEKLKLNEIKNLLNVLSIFNESFNQSNYAKLMIAYHKCRIFRNAFFMGKLLHIKLLLSFRYYYHFKKVFLVK